MYKNSLTESAECLRNIMHGLCRPNNFGTLFGGEGSRRVDAPGLFFFFGKTCCDQATRDSVQHYESVTML